LNTIFSNLQKFIEMYFIIDCRYDGKIPQVNRA
jgi:hypothetical protein